MAGASDLPPQLAEIAGIVGVAAALRLADEFGGQELYIPKAPRAGQKLVRCVGLDAARKLAREYGALHIEMPLATAASRARRNAQIIDAVENKGRSKASVARELRMTTRGVRKIVNRGKGQDERQRPLL